MLQLCKNSQNDGESGKHFERKISQKERVVNYDCELVFTPLQLN